MVDGLAHGLGFASVLVLLGGIREIIGTGGLLNGADRLFGPAAADIGFSFAANANGFLLALLPPGAFLGLALLLALRNALTTGDTATQAAAIPDGQSIASESAGT